MSTTDLATQFWRDGYLVIDGFFDRELMSQLDDNILEHFGAEPDFLHEADFLARSKTDVIPWFPQQDDLDGYRPDLAAPFDEVGSDPRLQRLTDAVFGAGWRQLYCMVMYSGPATNGQAWHQDCPPEDESRHNLNRLVYTRELTEETGGQTVVIPGSHRRGEISAGDPEESLSGEVVLSPSAGTLVLVHGHTWHRVLPVNGPFRFSANYRACPAGTPDDVTDVCVYRNMRYRFSTKELLEQRT